MLIDCDGRGAAAGRQHVRVFVMLAHLCTSVTALTMTMTDADSDDQAAMRRLGRLTRPRDDSTRLALETAGRMHQTSIADPGRDQGRAQPPGPACSNV